MTPNDLGVFALWVLIIVTWFCVCWKAGKLGGRWLVNRRERRLTTIDEPTSSFLMYSIMLPEVISRLMGRGRSSDIVVKNWSHFSIQLRRQLIREYKKQMMPGSDLRLTFHDTSYLLSNDWFEDDLVHPNIPVLREMYADDLVVQGLLDLLDDAH